MSLSLGDPFVPLISYDKLQPSRFPGIKIELQTFASLLIRYLLPMRLFASTALFALFPLPLVLGATYLLTDNIIGKTFYTNFDWEAIPDPTHGRV